MINTTNNDDAESSGTYNLGKAPASQLESRLLSMHLTQKSLPLRFNLNRLHWRVSIDVSQPKSEHRREWHYEVL